MELKKIKDWLNEEPKILLRLGIGLLSLGLATSMIYYIINWAT